MTGGAAESAGAAHAQNVFAKSEAFVFDLEAELEVTFVGLIVAVGGRVVDVGSGVAERSNRLALLG